MKPDGWAIAAASSGRGVCCLLARVERVRQAQSHGLENPNSQVRAPLALEPSWLVIVSRTRKRANAVPPSLTPLSGVVACRGSETWELGRRSNLPFRGISMGLPERECYSWGQRPASQGFRCIHRLSPETVNLSFDSKRPRIGSAACHHRLEERRRGWCGSSRSRLGRNHP